MHWWFAWLAPCRNARRRSDRRPAARRSTLHDEPVLHVDDACHARGDFLRAAQLAVAVDEAREHHGALVRLDADGDAAHVRVLQQRGLYLGGDYAVIDKAPGGHPLVDRLRLDELGGIELTVAIVVGLAEGLVKTADLACFLTAQVAVAVGIELVEARIGGLALTG